jgi:CHAD domain-containing protein
MTSAPSPDLLCRKHRNENLHTGHVAALAVELFDRTRKHLRLPAEDRRLLEVASRLHDVGFAVAPEAHAREGAGIVRREGVADFTRSECEIMAAAICLHSNAGADRPGPAASPSPGDAAAILRKAGFGLEGVALRRALRLAAFLRVADALDHAHIQRTSLERIRIRDGRVRVTVRCPGYPGVIRPAEAKADLWSRVFRLGIRFQYDPGRRGRPALAGVLKKRMTVREALRRLMFLHYRLTMDARAGILRRDDPIDLHDLRVSMRRLRAGLRLYMERWPARSPARICRRLVDVSARMGVIRDSQAWLEFLQSPRTREVGARDVAWPGYLRDVKRRTTQNTARLRRMLQGRPWARLAGDIARFLRIELAVQPTGDGGDTFRAYAARAVRRAYVDLERRGNATGSMTSEQFHELRRRIRRARYRAEFLAATGGRLGRRLVERLKSCADALGDLHDADVRLEMIERAARVRLPALRKFLRAERRDALDDFRRAWKKLQSRGFRKPALSGLAAMRRKHG